MASQGESLEKLERLLAAGGSRHLQDARRIARRVRWLAGEAVLSSTLDLPLCDLTCHALQLPLLRGRELKAMTFKDRCSQSATRLIEQLGASIDESSLEQCVLVLQQMPLRTARSDESRLLSDAMHLDEFGVQGVLLQALAIADLDQGLPQLIEALTKREQYGFWQSQLKDGFHFEASRREAQRRLVHLQRLSIMLMSEMEQEQ